MRGLRRASESPARGVADICRGPASKESFISDMWVMCSVGWKESPRSMRACWRIWDLTLMLIQEPLGPDLAPRDDSWLFLRSPWDLGDPGTLTIFPEHLKRSFPNLGEGRERLYHKYNIFFLLKASKCDNKIGLMTFVKGFDLHKTTPWHYIFSLVFVCSSDIGYPSLYEKKESLFSANSLSLCHHLLTFYLLYTTNYNSTNTALCLFSITNTIHFEHYCLANFHRRAHFDKF